MARKSHKMHLEAVHELHLDRGADPVKPGEDFECPAELGERLLASGAAKDLPARRVAPSKDDSEPASDPDDGAKLV